MPKADTLLVKQGRYGSVATMAPVSANALYHRYPIIAPRYWQALGWLMSHYHQQFHPATPQWPHNCIDPISYHYSKLLALSDKPHAEPREAMSELGFSFMLGPSAQLRLDLAEQGESRAPMSMANWYFEALQGFSHKLDALIQVGSEVVLKQDVTLKALDEILLALTPLVGRGIKSPHPFHDTDWVAVQESGIKLSHQQLNDRSYRLRLTNQEKDPTQRHKLNYFRLKWQPHGGDLTFCRLRRKGEAVPSISFNASPH
ncbi:MAG: hypothetical protein VX447_09655 [Pseudomonadota bacterium]|uniref:hypothetical protein n=1 Tax=Gallaecimonas pentaromativorans TaxID=584787 RepID=UPI00067ECCC5|nr:hypothetical protein [Gallaecimonas pentaromativorans]MED5525005.1 hypothetical protein [Pseudomonadota bacterium]